MMNKPADVLAFILQTDSGCGLIFRKKALLDWVEKTKNKLGKHELSFAVKAFPWSEGLQVFASRLDAVDVSNLTEAKLVMPYLKPEAEIWLTNGQVIDAQSIQDICEKRKIIWNVGSERDWQEAKKLNVHVALRISSSSLLKKDDPAFVASRFGFDRKNISNYSKADRDKVYALHCHHGGEKSTDETFKTLLSELLKLREEFPHLKKINLGGGWAKMSDPLISELAAMMPSDLIFVMEPGRAVTQEAGYAFSRVLSVEKRGERWFVEGELSPGAHLRWVRSHQWTLIPLAEGERVELNGEVWWGSSTCWEDDVLHLSKNGFSAGVGDVILWGHVAGYALSWNHSFNGIPQAKVFLV
ncbi:MAG: hypothetical protein K2P81_06490 [Bacteriovoracaceae bacterium]|nr:hypothetical protein [Bacteriovoracaceae bacterium]